MESAIEDEFEGQAAVVEGVRGLGQVNGSVIEEVRQNAKTFTPEPDGTCDNEGHGSGVEKEVEFVQFPSLMSIACILGYLSLVEESLGDDVLRDEDDGGQQGAHDPQKVSIEGLLA